MTFVVLWLAGDILNVAGSILQGVLPTMIALAVYYTIADIILLAQILIYNRRNNGENLPEITSLLHSKVDPSHLSPATPLIESFEDEEDSDDTPNTVSAILHTGNQENSRTRRTDNGTMDLEAEGSSSRKPLDINGSASPSSSSKSSQNTAMTKFREFAFNALMVIGVVASGIIGWAFSEYRHHDHDNLPDPSQPPPTLEFDFWGQVFGWGCAILYLGSRVPQILLNFKRKSVEGISFLFFLFACLGNLTYVISILVLDLSPRYLAINASWLAGSVGTLILDMVIFIQFWIYNRSCPEEEEEEEDEYFYNSDEE